METQAATTGIATIKPKRKYTRRKPKIVLVKPIKPTVKKELPKTARAYLRTLGMVADKEGTAIKELIKMHSILQKSSQEPAFTSDDLFTEAKPVSFWQRWFGK